MTTDQAIADLNAAFAKAQGEFPVIPRDKTVSVRTREGGSYSFAYAPLDTILAAVRPILAANDLAITQTLGDMLDGRPALKTELLHASGAKIGGSFPLGRVPETPQQLGSLLTYLRRYAIVALLGIATEEDDDGNHASGAVVQKTEGASEPGTGGSTFQAPSGLRELANTPLPDDHANRTGILPLTDAQRRMIFALLGKLEAWKPDLYEPDKVRAQLGVQYGTESVKELTRAQARDLLDLLQNTVRENGLE